MSTACMHFEVNLGGNHADPMCLTLNSSPDADFKDHINDYLAGFEWSQVRTLDELIQLNINHAAE